MLRTQAGRELDAPTTSGCKVVKCLERRRRMQPRTPEREYGVQRTGRKHGRLQPLQRETMVSGQRDVGQTRCRTRAGGRSPSPAAAQEHYPERAFRAGDRVVWRLTVVREDAIVGGQRHRLGATEFRPVVRSRAEDRLARSAGLIGHCAHHDLAAGSTRFGAHGYASELVTL